MTPLSDSVPGASSPLTKKSLRTLLREESFVVSPGVHDMFGLRAIEQAGFASAAISGAVLSHLMLGLPDVGLLGLQESVDHCRRLTRAASIPISADADAGYGNAFGVFHTVRLFEEAGATGVNIEDQVVPRRWNSGPGKEVVPLGEMVGKIEAACRARRFDDFAIIVRTDAFACEDTEAVVRRARAYAAAGADVLMPIGPKDADDVARVVDAVEIPVSLNIATGLAPAASSAGLSIDQLRRLGVRRVSLPNLLPVAASTAMAHALQQVRSLVEGAGATVPPMAGTVDSLKRTMRDSVWLRIEDELLQLGARNAATP